jgi:haloalkane dehalogenase
MEAIEAPQGRDHWDKMGMRRALEELRSEAGEAMVLQNNYFIEEILPNAILRKLSDDEMAEYRRPFAERRRATADADVARQIPIEGKPAYSSSFAVPFSASCRRWPARSRPANLPERNGSPPPSSRSQPATRGRG